MRARPVPAHYQSGRQAIGLYATRVTVVLVGTYKMLPLNPCCHGPARRRRACGAAAEPVGGLGKKLGGGAGGGIGRGAGSRNRATRAANSSALSEREPSASYSFRMATASAPVSSRPSFLSAWRSSRQESAPPPSTSNSANTSRTRSRTTCVFAAAASCFSSPRLRPSARRRRSMA